MKRILSISLLFLFFSFNKTYAYQFAYNAQKDTTYQIFSASIQNLEQNVGAIKSATWEQAYEALLKVNAVDPDGLSHLSGQYRFSERPFIQGEAYQLSDAKTYFSTFTRNPLGELHVFSEMDFYPTVRSIPVFPNKDIKIGEEWDSKGYEVQDFSVIGYRKPFNVPFKAHYQYLGDVDLTAKDLDVLLARYKLYNFNIAKETKGIDTFESAKEKGATVVNLTDDPKNPNAPKRHFALISVMYAINYLEQEQPIETERIKQVGAVPVTKATGYYKGIIYWDKDKGEEFFSLGEYDFTYTWENGDVRHWSGKEYGSVNTMKPTKQKVDALEKDAKATLDKSIEIDKEKEGVKLIFGDLLFEFNKTKLRTTVQATLDKVVELLKKNPHSIIRIGGYSDDIGSLDAKNKIAQGRARSVANYLVSHGIEMSRVTYKGHGDKNPRVPNTSEINRKKNRRVELDIIAG